MKSKYRTGEKAFTRKEWDKLMSAVGRLDDKILFLIGVNTGLRRTDVVNIEIANIDLGGCKITYYEKKKRRLRTVYISTALAQEIGIYLKTLPKRQKTLFTFRERTAWNRLNKTCDVAGIPRRPFHSLRATCVKFCQQAGWPPEAVAELTGDTIRTIQEHYATPSIAEMQEYAERRRIV